MRANLEAWHSDQKAAIGEGFAIYPEHNLHMLLYAASYDGQGAIATRAAKDYAKLTGDTFHDLTFLPFIHPPPYSPTLHMLLYAASYDGQGAIATRAGKDYAKLTGDTYQQVLTLIRFRAVR